MTLDQLQIFWFCTLGVLLAGYAVLDGFDLGVGILHPLTKTDKERRIALNAIGPLWDGNEVWLVTFGGALFAAFPEAYATAFSSFYVPFMLLLWMLIFRAISIEFRSKHKSTTWRKFWDCGFFIASLTVSLLLGVTVGNLIIGIPVGVDREYAGGLFDLLQPYPLLIGLFVVSTFAMHGALYLHLKTEGDLQKRVYEWCWTTFCVFLAMYMLTTIVTLINIPSVARHFTKYPIAWLIVGVNIFALSNIPRSIYYNKPLSAFLSSCAVILALVALLGLALFPNLVASSLNPNWNMTIYNSSSSEKTLMIIQTITLIGMPLVLIYTSIIYWVFRGKVVLDKSSY